MNPTRIAALLTLVIAFTCGIARADDFGPPRDVRDVNWAATRLLAYRYGAVALSDTVVVKDQAILTWRNAKATGVAGFVRYANRWWDAYEGQRLQPHDCDRQTATFPLRSIGMMTDDKLNLVFAGFSPDLIVAAQTHNAELHPPPPMHPDATGNVKFVTGVDCDVVVRDARAVQPSGGTLQNDPAQSGYRARLSYTSADAGGAKMDLRLRAPSLGEILPMPIPPKSMGGATSVAFLYLYVTSPSPVTLANTSLDVWVPWVLDDPAHYQIQLFEGKRSIGPLYGTISQNVLHFTIPAFAFSTGEAQGEIDYDW